MFRAVRDSEGSDFLKSISLISGDQLSAVYVLDETWYIGFNERHKNTGAFLSTCEEQQEYNAPRSEEKEEEKVYKAEDSSSKSNKNVRFDEIKLEHSVSIPETMASMQVPSFRGYSGDQLAKYDDCCNGTTEGKDTISVNGGSEHRFRKLSLLQSSTENLIKSSKEEKRGIKAIFGVISGLLIGLLMFLVYHYNFGYTLKEAGILMIVLTVLLCIGMALSTFIRCIIALVVPNFFTGIGRAILLSAIFALILKHPVSNISHNARETGSSIACVVELAANETRVLQRQFEKQHGGLKDLMDELHSKFTLVTDILNQTTMSDEALHVSRKKCRDVVKSVEAGCNINYTSAQANLTQLWKLSFCTGIDFSKNCDGIQLGVDLNDIVKKIRSALNDVTSHFDVDFGISEEFSVNANDSNTEVRKDKEGKLDAFDTAMSVIRKCLSLSLLLVFLMSFWYLRNYLAKDDYDNIYITKQFKEIDKEAEKNGRETVLPLKTREKSEYVNTLSFKLNSTEVSNSKIGLIQVLLHFLLCILIIIFDCVLYYILNLVREYGDIELEIESRGHVKIVVEGSGPIADFYNNSLGQGFNMTFDTGPCLPEPKEPSVAVVPVVLVLYVIALAVVLLRAYGMRLRRKVSAYYYPEQELARLDYLHKKIRHRRLGFLIFLRQQIRSTHKEEQVKNKFRFSSWLAFNCPFIAQILPRRNRVECTGCGQRETSLSKVKLTKCNGIKGGVHCDAVYCKECYTALQETCPLCVCTVPQETCPLCSSNGTLIPRE
ncbi:DC-STAMP domain-containing protein 2-like [Mercenaria mercenaria]|uniref:DC-STAMP domain-containing protein 2-like n=1 Tax=Mercenaria mercenaria TaxID=6596 RepID=UPI00234F52A7|nr:DC-STAMP domain-containing protein 2-like [Mercenaria mercenaria]